MSSMELRAELVLSIVNVTFWFTILLFVLSLCRIRVRFVFKSGMKISIRFRLHWALGYAILNLVPEAIARIVLGRIEDACWDFIAIVAIAIVYRFHKERDDDDDDDDGERISQALGGKARARIEQMKKRMTPSPIPSPSGA